MMRKQAETSIIIAHRGFNDTHPENSIQAFQEAIRKKCKYLEVDIRLTKDNVLVLFHDDTIKGQPISSLTDAKLITIQPVDTLESFMKIIDASATAQQIVLFDLKFTTRKEIEFFVAYMVDNHYLPYQRQTRMKDILQVTTHLVKVLHECLINRYAHTFYRISWLPDSNSDLETNFDLCEYTNIIMHNYKYFLDSIDNQKKDYKADIFVYTVNRSEDMEKLKQIPNNLIQGIVTDKSKFLTSCI
jgi:glycerophosphoryl diester phosphodiesterase